MQRCFEGYEDSALGSLRSIAFRTDWAQCQGTGQPENFSAGGGG